MKFDVGRVDVRKRDRLPHWEVEHGIYFVTFNLHDALPLEVRTRIREEAEAHAALIRKTRGELSIAERHAHEAEAVRIIERIVDAFRSADRSHRRERDHAF